MEEEKQARRSRGDIGEIYGRYKGGIGERYGRGGGEAGARGALSLSLALALTPILTGWRLGTETSHFGGSVPGGEEVGLVWVGEGVGAGAEVGVKVEILF